MSKLKTGVGKPRLSVEFRIAFEEDERGTFIK